MKIARLVTFGIAIIIASNVNAQSGAIKFSSVDLNEDFNFLVSSIIDAHPNAYLSISQTQFEYKVKTIKEQLNDSLSLKDFYRLIAPLVSSLKDGHTHLYFPGGKILNKSDYIFPFIVQSKISQPFLLVTDQIDSSHNQIPIGAEILNINNVTSKEIIHKIIENTSGENDAYRLKMGADFYMFGVVLDAFYDFNSGYYKVVYKLNQKTYTKKIQAVTIPQIQEILKNRKENKEIQKNDPDYELSLKPEIKTAIITFNSMNDKEKFQSFLQTSFEKIKDNHIENLIIDIRKNGGGNSELGDDLLKYICKVPFSQYKKTIIKYSQLQKNIYKKDCVNNNLNCDMYAQMKDKENGTLDTLVDSNHTFPNAIEHQFMGKVFLLTSTYTYSSAMNFAQTFKFYKIGEINGEETVGQIVSFGELINTELPHTKLNISISTKQFFTIGAADNAAHGVIPDNEMLAENALDYTLNEIQNAQ